MISATKKWIFLKISQCHFNSINVVVCFKFNYQFMINNLLKLKVFLLTSLSKFLFSIFIINAYFFSALSISEVFEDYIQNDKIKNVANKLLFASAIIIPLITIIFSNI